MLSSAISVVVAVVVESDALIFDVFISFSVSPGFAGSRDEGCEGRTNCCCCCCC
jgi:hypothetical protein